MLSSDEILAHHEHRPWPLPKRSWINRQHWHDLLFMHWPLPSDYLRAFVPEQLELDTHGGQAWLAVAPFHMSGVRMRGLPTLGPLSRLPELNVRTYVRYQGQPGVYFFSLDAGSVLAVWGARLTYHLPYFYARMDVKLAREAVVYSSYRVGTPRAADFVGSYGPISEEIHRCAKDSLEHFLTERYCLFTVAANRRVYRAEIHHVPWPLQVARADVATNTTALSHGIQLPETPPLLHYSKLLEVLIWPIERL
jgi:uncharacterized protein